LPYFASDFHYACARVYKSELTAHPDFARADALQQCRELGMVNGERR